MLSALSAFPIGFLLFYQRVKALHSIAQSSEAVYKSLVLGFFTVKPLTDIQSKLILLHHKLTETLGLYPTVLAYEIYYSLLHTLKI